MKKYKIIAAVTGFYAIIGIAVMWLNAKSDSVDPTNLYNAPCEIMIKIAGICIALGIAALIIFKLYNFIKHKLLKKPDNDDDINGYVIDGRSYRNRFHDE